MRLPAPRVASIARAAGVRLHAAAVRGPARRSLYLQWIDNGFLQEKGSSRYSREIEMPAHRGRIIDRNGEPLAIRTPVEIDLGVPERGRGHADAARRRSPRLLEIRRPALLKQRSRERRRIRLPRSGRLPPEAAEHVAALQINGHPRPERIPALLPGRRGDEPRSLGFTGVDDPARKASSSRSRHGSAGSAGSRRVIIDRRGDIVEDVGAIRAPQEGRDLALSIDRKLQYLAFRELKAAVERNKAKAGGAGRARRARPARSWRSPTGRRTTRTTASRSRATACAIAR